MSVPKNVSSHLRSYSLSISSDPSPNCNTSLHKLRDFLSHGLLSFIIIHESFQRNCFIVPSLTTVRYLSFADKSFWHPHSQAPPQRSCRLGQGLPFFPNLINLTRLIQLLHVEIYSCRSFVKINVTQKKYHKKYFVINLTTL